MGLHVIFSERFLPGGVGLKTGVPLIALGTTLFTWAVATMRRAGTSPEPRQPAFTLVTWGLFRYTRNPIYVAYALMYAGIAFMLGFI